MLGADDRLSTACIRRVNRKDTRREALASPDPVGLT